MKKDIDKATKKKASADMKNITEVNNGFMVRKTVFGEVMQSFFGYSAHGGRDMALAKAKARRAELELKNAANRSLKTTHDKNVTGIIGVSWHFGQNQARSGFFSNFRARFNESQDEVSACAFSLERYGPWNAYQQAAEWRLGLEGRTISKADLEKNFIKFLSHYKETYEASDFDEKNFLYKGYIMIHGSYRDGSLSKEVLKEFPEDVLECLNRSRNMMDMLNAGSGKKMRTDNFLGINGFSWQIGEVPFTDVNAFNYFSVRYNDVASPDTEHFRKFTISNLKPWSAFRRANTLLIEMTSDYRSDEEVKEKFTEFLDIVAEKYESEKSEAIRNELERMFLNLYLECESYRAPRSFLDHVPEAAKAMYSDIEATNDGTNLIIENEGVKEIDHQVLSFSDAKKRRAAN